MHLGVCSRVGSFRMPPDAASDEIDATFRNGVLNITIPKRQPAMNGGRRVAVRAE